jgi:copper chaperone
MKTEILSVNGMSCSHCVHAIKTSVLALKGSKDVEVDLSAKTVKIEYDAEKLSLDSIKLAIVDAGYDIA